MTNVKVSKQEMKKMKWSREQQLDYYCNNNNLMSFSRGNKKLGSQVVGIALPPIVTCRPDAPCFKACYATKGHQIFPSVLGSYQKNLRLWNENPIDLFEQIVWFLKHKGYRYVRFFDSGDLPNANFFDLSVKLCKEMPEIKFCMFTKKYEIVNNFLKQGGEIPSNFVVIFSAWTKYWKFENPFNLPVAYVNFKQKSLNPDFPKEAKICGECCSICYQCFHLQKGDGLILNQH